MDMAKSNKRRIIIYRNYSMASLVGLPVACLFGGFALSAAFSIAFRDSPSKFEILFDKFVDVVLALVVTILITQKREKKSRVKEKMLNYLCNVEQFLIPIEIDSDNIGEKLNGLKFAAKDLEHARIVATNSCSRKMINSFQSATRLLKACSTTASTPTSIASNDKNFVALKNKINKLFIEIEKM